MRSSNAKLVLIGWHGADWKAIHPLIDAGRMPHLEALIERGVAANLKASGPPVAAALWNSITTGKKADQHGISFDREPDPLTGGTRPVRSTSRRVKALWNIAMQSGLKSHTVGWFGLHPAEELNGCCVSPGFVQPLAPYGAPWPVLPDSLYPERLTSDLAALRVHAGELAGQDLLPFIPSLDEIDQEKDRRVVEFADTLAQTISTHAVTTWLLEHEPWDLMLIGWTGLQRACHSFMRYAAPPMPAILHEDCARYGQIVTELYCFYDALLGRIIELAGAGATVALVSAAGFRSGAERPLSEALQANPSSWYRPYGLFCLAGPNIAADELLHNVGMFDVTPTMLGVLGLPVGEDLPGRVLAEAFVSQPIFDRIPSWEHVPGECGMHAPETDEERVRLTAMLGELAQLGYGTAANHVSASNRSLVEAYQHFLRGDLVACAAALHDAPKSGLAAAHGKILESHLETARGNTSQAVAAIAAAERLGFDRPLVNWIAGWAYVRHGQLSRAEASLRQATKLDASFEQAHALLARVLAMRGRGEEAAEMALSGLSIDYASASLHSALGIALLASGDEEKALKAFEKALGFDPEWPEAVAWTAQLAARRQSA